MEKGIINFTDFIKDNKVEDKSTFKKEDFDDFFLKKDEIIKEDNNIEFNEEEEEVNYIDDVINSEEEEEEEQEEQEEIIESNKSDKYYTLYNDKSESFSCDISVEGANIKETEVRLVLESNNWTLMFTGEIDSNGKCTVPIKKLNIFNEGLIGKIRLEVIAEGSIFVPWEDEFKIKLSKKVSVKIHENKSNFSEKSGVKVKIKR